MDATRSNYYAREARKSAKLAQDALKRGDFRAAKRWAQCADSERDLAAFWRSPDAPELREPAPAFMESGYAD